MRKKVQYKVAFCGDFTQNNGPANVNKSLIDYLDYYVIDTKNKNKLKLLFQFLIALIKCKIFIFSSNYRTNYILFRITCFFHKKSIYLMHGCSELDAKINKVKNSNKMISMEKKLLSKVDLILVVSETYMNIVNKIFPMFKDKMYFITSGIDIKKYSNEVHNNNRNNNVAVCGGNRNIKCNYNVSLAINEINKEENNKCLLNIYGLLYDNNEIIKENEYVKIHGRLNQNDLFNELKSTRLFVLNSKYESFGLSIIDALMCGCNILISSNAGIREILKLNDTDIINDYNDISEIKEKIMYNLSHNNNERILKSIDFNHYSWNAVAERLNKIIDYYYNEKDYKTIK